jgi:glycosyltransferase involved in cell wall biosynthesis
VVVVGNEGILNQLIAQENLCKPTFLCEDGVDCDEFKPLPFPEEFTVGWCGDSSARNGTIKGVSAIADAADIAGVKLECLDMAAGKGLPWKKLLDWYGLISCYVCASSEEGTPNPPLEAMACGRPVVSTRVGILPRVVQHGASGYFVNRDRDSIAYGIQAVKDGDLGAMGAAARKAVEAHDWKLKIGHWRAALHAALAPKRADIFPPVTKRRTNGSRPRFLLVADVRGWAFDVNNQDMARYLGDWADFEHFYIDDALASPPACRRFAGVFLPYRNWPLSHYWAALPQLGALRSADLDPTRPGEVPDEDADAILSSAGWHVVTREAEARLAPLFPGKIVYLTNPVDMDRFPEPTTVSDRVIASWNGNANHASGVADVKGFGSIVRPACEAAGVELRFAEYTTCRLPREAMPAFYRRANVALCASSYEGASNSVMEAMASGLAVIATDVGNHREMQESQIKHLGASGMILLEDRSVESFAEALRNLTPARALEMGALNRQEIAERWSWTAWAPAYREFFSRVLA